MIHPILVLNVIGVLNCNMIDENVKVKTDYTMVWYKRVY